MYGLPMWWHDIAEIKDWMVNIAARLTEMQMKHLENEDGEIGTLRSVESKLEEIKETINDTFCPSNENNTFNLMCEKLNTLVHDVDRKRQVQLAQTTLDKFEDYMKNVNVLNSMINEFKGCVSMARSAIADRREMDKEAQELKKTTHIAQEIYNAMVSFISASTRVNNQHFKIDAIYKALCEDEPKPKKKPARKKKVNPSP